MIPIIKRLLFGLIQKLLSTPFFVIDLLSPAFYLKRLRFKVVDCKESSSRNLAIFVVYQKNSLPFYVKNMIEALLANDVRVVVTVNGEANSHTRTYLEATCHRVIYRKNTGRDFGAYKDALSTEIIDRYQKIFLVNDSVFYFKKNLKKLIGEILENRQGWVSLSDNYNECYHAQSFFLCFGGEVLRSKVFNAFWNRYLPFNPRHYVIKYGELKLSQVLLDAGVHCHVINSGLYLRLRLGDLDGSELDHIKDFLPVAFLRRHPEVLIKQGRLLIQHLVFACESFPPTSHGLYPIFGILSGVAIFKRDLVLRCMTTVDEFRSLLEEMKLNSSEIDAALDELSLDARFHPRGLFEKINFRFDIL